MVSAQLNKAPCQKMCAYKRLAVPFLFIFEQFPTYLGNMRVRGTYKMLDNTAVAASKQKNTNNKKINLRINWADKATDTLIEVWAEKNHTDCLRNPKSSKDTCSVYQNLEVSSEVMSAHFALRCLYLSQMLRKQQTVRGFPGQHQDNNCHWHYHYYYCHCY